MHKITRQEEREPGLEYRCAGSRVHTLKRSPMCSVGLGEPRKAMVQVSPGCLDAGLRVSVMDLTWKCDWWALASLARFRLELLLPVVAFDVSLQSPL